MLIPTSCTTHVQTSLTGKNSLMKVLLMEVLVLPLSALQHAVFDWRVCGHADGRHTFG